MRIFDFSSCPLSDRNSSYGGNSGDKEGILIDGEPWIIKYPKKCMLLKNITDLLYSTSPESEFIGSHIYEILGYPVHKTILGIRNNHVVVACKDLCDDETRLIEFRQLKNTYNEILNNKLELSMASAGREHFVLLNEVLTHLEYNPSIKNIQGIKERFWDCVIIDGLINNNDRNNGNWGILRNKKGDVLSPVYDNGASFSPNVSETRIINKLNNIDSLVKGIFDSITVYSVDGEKNANFADLIKLENQDLKKSIKRTAPLIKEKLSEIYSMIDAIPESVEDFSILSKERKELYKKEIAIRFDKIIMPCYEQIVSQNKSLYKRNNFEHLR